MALPLPNTTAVQITRLTKALYNAAPGNTYMTAFTASAGTTTAEMTTFANWFAATVSSSAATLASTVVTNLGLTGDAATAGTAYLTAQFAANAGNYGRVILDAMNALSTLTSDATYGTAASTFNDSIATAYAYSIDTDNTSTNLVTLQAADEAVAATTGQTFTLTTGANNLTGTSGDDTFDGALVDQATAANSTITAADVIAGGAGTDTLNVTGTGTTLDVLNSALVSGIETINVRATTANSLNASNASGLTTVNANMGAGTLLVTNLAAGAAVTLTGNATVVQGKVAFAPVTAASAIKLNFANGVNQTAGDSVTAVGTIAAGDADGTATSATITSTGAANVTSTVDLANNTLTAVTINATTNLKGDFLSQATGQVAAGGALTVSGAASSVNLTAALDNDLATIDASGLTAGGLTATLGSLVSMKVTGGAGNDVITTGAVLTTGTVDGGAGTDTLVIGSNVAHLNTSSLVAKYTNFETLRLNGTFDAALIPAFTGIELTAATNAVTNLNATQAANVTAYGTAIGATTLTLATATGTSDVLNLKMGTGLTTAAAATAGVLTITGFETLNLTTNAGPTATVGANRLTTVTGAIVDTSLTAINLYGTAVKFTDIATTKAVTIDAAALTGDGQSTAEGLTVAGNATAGSTITGSAYKDTVALGTVGSTYNTGAGNDAFTATAVSQIQSGAVYNTLNGGDGTDTLTITSVGATMVDDDFKGISNIESVTVASGGGAASITTGGWYDAAFKTSGVTIDLSTVANGDTATFAGGTFSGAQTLKVTTAGDGASTADNVTIQTGSGADTVNVQATSWVGGAGAVGVMSIKTGAGIDNITVAVGTLLKVTGTAPVTITAGTGADIINVTSVECDTDVGTLSTTYVIAAGDSTVSAYDSITGFDLVGANLQSQTLDFDSKTLTAYSATAATGFSAAELTVAVSATGVVTFAGTSASALTLAQKVSAVQSVVITNAGDMAMFTNGANTYVFNNNATSDSLVELVGVTGTGLITTNGDTASTFVGAIFIA